MNQDVLKDIKDTEDKLQTAKADAHAAAKNMINDAEKKGLQAVSDAVRRAEEEAARLLEEADRQADIQAAALKEATEKEQAEIRRRAGSRLDDAAGIIVERVVNG